MLNHPIILAFRPAIRGSMAACAAALAGAWVPAALSQQTYNEVGPEARGLQVREHLGAPLPMEAEFVDADGKNVHLGDYFTHTNPDGTVVPGKPAVVALVFYSCPVVCNSTINTLIDCARGIEGMTVGKDYQMLFFSYDPRDAVIAAQGKRDHSVRAYGRGETDEIKRGIQFHAGSAESGRQLANAFGFEYRELANGEFSHPIVFFMVTPDGKIARYMYSFGHTAQQLRLAVLDAGSGQVTQSLPDRLLSFCYMYDPRMGRYTMNAVRVMQLGGILTVLTLGSVIASLLIAERIKKRRQARSTNNKPRGSSGGAVAVQ